MKRSLFLPGVLWVMAGWGQETVVEAQAGPAARIDFVKQVQPLLQARCFKCHGPDNQEGQLRLDASSAVARGGVSGPVIEPGDPGKSSLYQRLITRDADVRMPLNEPALKPAEVTLLKRWIEQGAKWPSGVGVQLDVTRKHWAYQAPVTPALAKVRNASWIRNPVDAFVLAGMESRQLVPAPEADRRRLVRRLYLDLVGLPPSVETVERFANSKDPRAYEQLVDQLLDSPRYGEKWARAWLDLARYADSNGYQADQYRNVWPYRDWVIRAINADMPFDQFTIEQLAGDLLPNPTVEQKIATGFQRLTTCNVEAGVDPEENRVNQIIDRVNTMGTVWLGTTVECMQCHSHKYDPFSQREYYQLFAFFNNTPLEVSGNGVSYNFVGPKMNLPYTASQQKDRQRWQAEADRLQTMIIQRQKEQRAELQTWETKARKHLMKDPWQVLTPVTFQSQGGASHEILEDQSILVSGARPLTDVYTVTIRTRLQEINGFRLETLTHPSLPGKGPGRHHEERPNFVLNELTVMSTIVGGKDPAQAVALQDAQADFSQAKFPVAGAIDGKPGTAWAIAPRYHKSHQATFRTRTSLAGAGERELVFTLDQHHGATRTLGRFRISALTGDPAFQALPKAVSSVLRIPTAKRNAKQQQVLVDYHARQDPRLKKWMDQRKKLQDQLQNQQQVTTLVMVEQAKPRMSSVFKRGNFKSPGDRVTAEVLRVLHPFSSGLPRNRLGLARWLMDEQNPLTARVTVNRWWAGFFGRGLVTTMEDFGTQGERPTHPELLDFLARELISHGWSRKYLHKLIVMSATYRQSARGKVIAWERDVDNQWLTRGPRFRLSAETIRDNALTISGLMTHKLGGPPVYPPQPAGVWRHVGRNEPKFVTSVGEDRFRRGIYVVWRRSAPYPSFTTFDAPDRATCLVDRSRTNTPLQALTLLNDPAYVEMMHAYSRRIVRAVDGRDDHERVEYAFQMAVARKPRLAEVELLVQVVREQRQRFKRDRQAARELVSPEDRDAPDLVELAAWFHVANILMNLDETITKG